MLGILVVSHSERLAEGIMELAEQMNYGQVKLMAAGGSENGIIGTNPLYIQQVLESAADCSHVLVFVDLGSAILSTNCALEMLDEHIRNKVTIVDAPIVEGTVMAVIQAGITECIADIMNTAIGAKKLRKL